MFLSVTPIDAALLTKLIVSIPDEWESITKSEVKLADRLEQTAIVRLLLEDIEYARSEEQDEFYRHLLRTIRDRTALH